jgi:hypothetical protein
VTKIGALGTTQAATSTDVRCEEIPSEKPQILQFAGLTPVLTKLQVKSHLWTYASPFLREEQSFIFRISELQKQFAEGEGFNIR